MMHEGCQFLNIGAEITGLTIARELVARGAEDIIILEKGPL
jgi:glycine/D-amino acid oxidase-like deaminating enzyme